MDAGRSLGKSTLCSVYALHVVDELSRFMKVPLSVTFLSSQPTIYTLMDNWFYKNPDLTLRLRVEGKSLLVPSHSFQFEDTRGFCERLIPTGKQVRSHRANVLLCDESSMIDDEILKTAMPLVTEPLCQIVWISTPSKSPSLFNQYMTNPPDNWKVLKYSSEVCPYTSKMRETVKETLTPEEYSREILAEIPPISIQTLLSSKDVDKCTESYLNYSGKHDKLTLGLDFGFTRSKCAIVLCEWDKAYRKIIKTWQFDNNTLNLYEEMGKVINYAYSLDKLVRVFADSRPDYFIPNLQKYSKAHIYPIEKNEAIKNQLVQQLYNLTKTFHLKIPETETLLISELKNYTKSKVYKTDLCDALMLSIAELPDVKLSHSLVVFGRNRDNYLMPKWKELPKSAWNRGY